MKGALATILLRPAFHAAMCQRLHCNSCDSQEPHPPTRARSFEFYCSVRAKNASIESRSWEIKEHTPNLYPVGRIYKFCSIREIIDYCVRGSGTLAKSPNTILSGERGTLTRFGETPRVLQFLSPMSERFEAMLIWDPHASKTTSPTRRRARSGSRVRWHRSCPSSGSP
jgi:hypothetical protein